MDADTPEKKLTNLLARIGTAEDLASKRLWRQQEDADLRTEIFKTLTDILTPDSELQREYDRERRVTRWQEVSRDGYIGSHEIGETLIWKDFIIKVLDSLGETVEINQQVVPAGQFFTARAAVRQIMSNAKSTVAIFDEYLDDAEVLNIVEPYATNGIAIRLLKKSPRNSFKSDVNAFRKQHGSVVELRDYATGCHDRFIVLDDASVYSIGGSLKDLGSKVTVINRLNDQEAAKYVTMFNGWWSAATVIY